MGKYKLSIYKVTILPIAQDDLADIAEHLNTMPLKTALGYYEAFANAIGSLRYLPQRYAVAKDAQLRLRGYRCLPAGDYLVFFVIAGNTAQIRRILFGKRQYASLLS